MTVPDSQRRLPPELPLPRADLMRPPRPSPHRPWSPAQVAVAETWPTRRDQPVSLAISPLADRLALSVGQRLTISSISGQSISSPLFHSTCALTPGLTWSPLSDKLAFRDDDGKVRVLDLYGDLGKDGQLPSETLETASAMAFAPDGDRLAALALSLPGRMTLTLLGTDRMAIWQTVLARNRMFSNRSDGVNLAWSPNGKWLACTTGTSSIWLVDAADGQVVGTYGHHSLTVTGLSWIDDNCIVSASEDATLQVWHPDGSVPATVVETISAAGMLFVRSQKIALIWSTNGELFAWSLRDAPVELWYRDPPLRSVAAHFSRLAVSAVDRMLVLVDPGATDLITVSDWSRTPGTPSGTTTYANAKVLLLGDSGVGKSGLGMVLAGWEFHPTESTHGRRIWPLPAGEGAADPGDEREVLVWDLAGQPGYRIVHQLHLGGAALALIVFDSRNETSPLLGVRHWARAVKHAHQLPAGGPPMFLVAARIDRGGTSVSDDRIDQLRAEFAIDAYFKTSALNGTNTNLLRSRILEAIDWERIPKITSTALFAAMKRFVIEQKDSGNLLNPIAELSQAFQKSVPSGLQLLNAEHAVSRAESPQAQQASPAELAAVFEGCLARLESAGMVKRLKFGDYVLLQPELLDAYASAIVNAARDEPDGLGSILESRVIGIDFPVPGLDRVNGDQQERLLVFATLEELIQNELVLREDTEDGIQLVFPAAYRRDMPMSEEPKGDGVLFGFEGPIDNIYSTLIVRLTRSNRFTRTAIWQSAAKFAAEGGVCTVFLKSVGDGKAELWIGYEGVPRHLRTQFERFVYAQLDRRATPGTVTRQRLYSCPEDNTAFTQQMIERVRNRGRDYIICPVCEDRVILRDDYELSAGTDQLTAAMDESADRGREYEAASTVLRGKEEVAEFDVFLCHQVTDKAAVRDLAQKLRERGLRPWLEEHESRPGLPWQRVLEEQMQTIAAAVVIVGSAVGPWHDQELTTFLRQFARRGCPVIPVLLPGVERPELPVFLDGMTWVELAVCDPDPLDQLEWGITGRHP
jgi:GTPase SAR1 family protein/nucleotide-binding universal stress UspA family protein